MCCGFRALAESSDPIYEASSLWVYPNRTDPGGPLDLARAGPVRAYPKCTARWRFHEGSLHDMGKYLGYVGR